MRTMLSQASGYLDRRRARRVWLRVLFALACVVVFCTTYALILPAITMEHPTCGLEEHAHTAACYTLVAAPSDDASEESAAPEAAADDEAPASEETTASEETVASEQPAADAGADVAQAQAQTQLACSYETLGVHQHTADCYDADGNLICGYADYVVHTHTAECYDEDGNLVCALPEIEAHTHTADCYTTVTTEGHVHTADCYTPERGELICGLEEGEGAHVHTDACYDADGNLVCGLEESAGHVHTDACYAWNEVLTCTQSTDPVTTTVLTCDKPEIIPHTHTDACYDEDGNLVCGMVEVTEHVHDASCYQTVEVEAADATEATATETAASEETTDPATALAADSANTVETEQPPAIEDIAADIASDVLPDTSGTPTDSATALTAADIEGLTADQIDLETIASLEPLTCGLEEDENHTHTVMCYGTWELTCGLEEHTHDASCYSDPTADLETAEDWEATLPAAEELTGDRAADLIAVAMSQLGYTESASNYMLAADGATHLGYTRYGAWYGDPYGDWCAMFVSFCLTYANIPTSDVPQDANCESWVAQLQEAGMYVTPAAYDPQPGDLVFFDNDQDGVADHVGIVAERIAAGLFNGEQIKTIEGNSSDKVQQVTYNLDDASILGYAALDGDPVLTRTVSGDDYTVTVSYTPDAAIPDEAELRVSEYDQDSETYQTRYAEAAAFYGWDDGEEQSDDVRLFNIGFYLGDDEVQPAAEVSVTVTYTNKSGEDVRYRVVHFADDGAESVSASTATEGSTKSVGFALSSFSDIMLLALPSDLTDAPVVIATSAQNGLAMLASTATVTSGTGYNQQTATYMTSGSVTLNADYTAVSIAANQNAKWTFEDAGNGTYYISNNGSYLYLGVTGNGNNRVANLALDSSNRTAFVLNEQADGSCILSASTGTGNNTTTYYLAIQQNNGTYYFAPVTNETQAAALYLINDITVTGTVAGLTPMGTVINLFDYSVAGDVSTEVGQPVSNTSGINGLSNLKFNVHGDTTYGTANYWTGNGNNSSFGQGGVLQGIVSASLGEDGYPYLSGDNTIIAGDTTSLAYLFDPSYAVAATNNGITISYKASYTNVGGLLQIDESGYYYYNSKTNYAEYNEDTNSFILYESPAVEYNNDSVNAGEFFPFNAYNTLADDIQADDGSLNHYFGLTLTTRFVQEYNGYTDSTYSTPTTFEFSGDDDVWIFIDDVLVADLGGIHDAASVKIDFSTGTVTISKVYNGRYADSTENKTTFFSDIFDGTSVELQSVTVDDETYTTLTNESYHTLKFFYLERGGNASNLMLKYNLREIPTSGIVKVDQYGDAVADAEFALYAALKDDNGAYKYKLDALDEETAPVYIGLDGLTYTIDADGKITIKDESGEYNNRTITPIYYGVTDDFGNLSFLDDDRMPLALADLQNRAGGNTHFILREIGVPTGYRLVADEVWLYLEGSILYCDNVYSSGAWASPSALLSATHDLYLNDSLLVQLDESLPSSVENVNGEYVAHYYSFDEQSQVVTNGTLFAVVLKYIGPTQSADPEGALSNEANWVPVYGNDMDGYVLQDTNDAATRTDFMNAVITTAKTMEGSDSYSDSVFTLGTSGAMQLQLTCLPGDLKTYYNLLARNYEGDKSSNDYYSYLLANMNYAVAYYWTPGTLENASAENTFRVDADHGDGFTRTYGATIEVPNLVNRLFVQKLDDDGNLVNGATFAMYSVGQDANESTFYYIADDGTHIYLNSAGADNSGTARVGNDTNYTYAIATTGVITVTNGTTIYTIDPVATQKTGESSIANENGTAVFGGDDLEQGYYCIREVAAPNGYGLNTAEIQVVIDETAIYANAGTTNDGVVVGRGPGYIVSTLDQFASPDEIDNTLTWIYERMRVTGETTSFAAVYGSGWTDAGETKYLVYDNDDEYELYNYSVNAARSDKDDADTDTRFYTDTGWSYIELHQDYDWAMGNEDGIDAHLTEGANYTDLRGYGDISNLFSRSTYIQVTDPKVSNLEISKTVVAEGNGQLTTEDLDQSFTFTVTLTGSDNAPLAGSYAYTVYNVDATTGERTFSLSSVINNGGTISLKHNQVAVITDLPYNAKYTVMETSVSGYATTVSVDGAQASLTLTTGSQLLKWAAAPEGVSINNTSTVAFTNTREQTTNLTVVKVDGATINSGSPTTLSGARFVLTRTVNADDEGTSTKYYYKYDNDKSETTWEQLSEGVEESDYALTTDSSGEIKLHNIPNGTYSLKEITAPNGYNLLSSEITITVTGGKITTVMFSGGSTSNSIDIGNDGLTITVPNSSGIELPHTGGSGTTLLYTLGGLLLVAGAVMCGLMARRNRGRRTAD